MRNKELKSRIREQDKKVTELANQALEVRGNTIIIHKAKKEEYQRELRKLEQLWEEEEDEKPHLQIQLGHRYAVYVIVDDLIAPTIEKKKLYKRIPIQKAYEYEPKIIDGEYVVEVTPNPQYKGDISKITRCFTTDLNGQDKGI